MQGFSDSDKSSVKSLIDGYFLHDKNQDDAMKSNNSQLFDESFAIKVKIAKVCLSLVLHITQSNGYSTDYEHLGVDLVCSSPNKMEYYMNALKEKFA